MTKKQNKDINNVQRYIDLENMNIENLETCFEYLCKYADLKNVDLAEIQSVIDFSYEKDNKDIQVQTVLEYLEVKNIKAKFWVEKTVKYNGLKNWASWMQKKFVSEGE